LNGFFFFIFSSSLYSTPAYDYAPNPDKQWILQVTGRMEPIHRKFTDILMTKRLQTLQSIDEGIERVSETFCFLWSKKICQRRGYGNDVKS
jgi:hypothetical protein